MGLALVLALIVAPEDADQGISQRIFYIHVPIALTAYFCFGLGAFKALLHLWKGDERYDLESYVAIHQGTIFGALTLITGSIWAEASWGRVVDVEREPTRAVPRALPLLLRVLHAPLLARGRSRDARGRRRYTHCSASSLIPVSFLAIRLAEDFIHPTVFTRDGPQISATMFATFLVCWAAVTFLAYVLYRVELAGKRLDARSAGASRGAAVTLEPERAGRRGVLRRLRVRPRLRRDHRRKTGTSPARDGRARRARSRQVERRRVTRRADAYAALVVTRPLPLQAPTAFVRIRPRGVRLCGEARRSTVRRCAPRRPSRK